MHAGEQQQTVTKLRLSLFIFSWSFATAFHQFYLRHWWESPLDAATTVFALMCMLLPQSLALFLGFAFIHVAVLISGMPYLVNHAVFALLIDLILLITAGKAYCQRNKDGSMAERVYLQFAPVARCALILLYFFVVLHKLNYDFLFNLDQSCALVIYERMSRKLSSLVFLPPLGHDWIKVALIVGTFVSEAIIPILLIMPRFTHFGLLWGSLFHGLIIITNADFTAYVYAMYTLFFPEHIYRRYATGINFKKICRLPALFTSVSTSRFMATFATALLIGWSVSHIKLGYRHRNIGAIIFFMFALPFLVVVVKIFYVKLMEARRYFSVRELITIQSLPLVLIVFVGFSPYLSFRTEGSFSMFSNLRTEGTITNHLFMPRWHVFGYQDDLVEVTRTTSPDLQRMSQGRSLVYKTFENYLRQAFNRGEDFEVDYHRTNREVQSVKSIRELAGELENPNYLESKLLYFRPVWPDNRCVH